MRPRRFFVALLSAVLLAEAPVEQPSCAQPNPDAARITKPDARKARQFYQKGLSAEQAGDWGAAFEAYSEAVSYAPGDTQALYRREEARFQLVRQHTDRAEREVLAGRLVEAREQLRAALEVDPGYSVARERLAQLESVASSPVEQASSSPANPLPIRPQSGTRDFDSRGDVRSAYEAVANAFGLAAAFDSDLAARTIRFRVRGVDFRTAMSLLSQQTHTFWLALDQHTFFVAENTPQKRSQYAPVVVRTILLPNSLTPDRMTETLRLVREIAGAAHTELDMRSRTLTLRDSPETVALAEAIVQEVEQFPGELMLEIELLEVDQQTARRLGITPPSNERVFTLSPQDVREARQSTQGLLAVIRRLFGLPTTVAGLNPAQGAAGGPLGLGSLVPPLVAFGGGRTVFFSPLYGAAADFSQTFSLVRSGRRMLLRALDGQPATFFIGERFPVALALLGSSFLPSQFVPSTNQPIFPRTDFLTGKMPVAVIAADFNGDGRFDLAVADQGANTVSVLLGKGDGTFLTRNDFATGTSPVAVASGDFNGDGKMDLAVVNRDANSVSILLGNSDGTFNTKTDFSTGSSPVAIAVGDFNADGKLDLAVVNRGSNTVSILLGKGDGTFGTKTDFPTGRSPAAIAVADFNADGKPDLAVTNQDDNTVSILLGKGDGTFGARTDFPTGSGPAGIAVADLNGDRKPDLAVVHPGANTVSILLGKGDGTFNAKNDFGTGNNPVSLVAADLNGDSFADLAISNQGSNTVSVLLGKGDGTFSFRFDLVTGTSPAGIVAIDLNGDGRPDVVLADQTADTITVILNSGASFLASGGTPQIAYPGAGYEDLGLKVRATPRLHIGDEVTLRLQFEIRSLAGTSVNGIPVISNRTLEQTVRLHENETTLLSGILEQDETRAITGLPGFARATAAGHLAGRRDTQKNATELLFLITPRQLRLAPRADRLIYAGRGEVSPTSQRTPVVQ
ncbi:MAG TPA: FG-GAP-like repeat-containing protein [Candidatus Acidoferrales bacterium]|nr:FG-GAP-like repeat-containing protein [Candidatus Acidoferrales bacterium]